MLGVWAGGWWDGVRGEVCQHLVVAAKKPLSWYKLLCRVLSCAWRNFHRDAWQGFCPVLLPRELNGFVATWDRFEVYFNE